MITNAQAGPSSTLQPATMFAPPGSMLAPLPGQSTFQPPQPQPPPQPYNYPPAPQPYQPPPPVPGVAHDRWENMNTLFHSIRDHARTYEYPAVSVAALETILIRLYLESPVNVGIGAQPVIAAATQNSTTPQTAAPAASQMARNGAQASGSTGSTSSHTSVEE